MDNYSLGRLVNTTEHDFGIVPIHDPIECICALDKEDGNTGFIVFTDMFEHSSLKYNLISGPISPIGSNLKTLSPFEIGVYVQSYEQHDKTVSTVYVVPDEKHTYSTLNETSIRLTCRSLIMPDLPSPSQAGKRKFFSDSSTPDSEF